MIAAAVAAMGAATLGLLTLYLARSAMRDSWRPGRSEVVAVTALAGLTSLSATEWLAAAPVALPLVIAGPAAAVVDAREGRLPDVLTFPMCAATVLITALGTPGAARSLLSAVGITFGAVLIAVVAGGALGWGDVKLLPTLVLVLSGHDALTAGLMAVLTILVLTTIFVWIYDRRALVPYGPALVIGTLLTIGSG